MGAILSACNGGSHLSNQARAKGLPTNPLVWTEEQTKEAAKLMFTAYDADRNGSVSRHELYNLFRDSGSELANFGTDDLDFDDVIDQLMEKYDRDGSRELEYAEFEPLFVQMVDRMATEGFKNEHQLPQFQSAIKDAIKKTHVLIVSLDYKYDPTLELTGIVDGQNIEKMARAAGVEDIVVLFDNIDFKESKFPLKNNIRRAMKEMGSRCGPNDLFFFFYSGHGLNVPDDDGDEADGEDEAFATPDKSGELNIDHVLIDDDFARYLDKLIPVETRILVVTDCCHSGSICDIDSFNYKHEIIQMSSADDSETSLDMSTFGREGGVLTCSIGDTIKELNRQQKKDISVADIFNGCVDKVAAIAKKAKHQQKVGIQHANIEPHEFPWPFVRAAF